MTQLGTFIGVMMVISSVGILISYGLLRKAFIDSPSLQNSRYKDTLEHGFFIIAVAYIIRAAYSLCFQEFVKLQTNGKSFELYILQFSLNLLMDLPVILIVLGINRRAVHLRQEIEEEKEKERLEEEAYDIAARRADIDDHINIAEQEGSRLSDET